MEKKTIDGMKVLQIEYCDKFEWLKISNIYNWNMFIIFISRNSSAKSQYELARTNKTIVERLSREHLRTIFRSSVISSEVISQIARESVRSFIVSEVWILGILGCRSSRIGGKNYRNTCTEIGFNGARGETGGRRGTRKKQPRGSGAGKKDRKARNSEGETGGWREMKVLPRRISSRVPGEIGAVCIDLYAQ